MTSHLPSVWPSSSAHTRIITKPIAPTRIKTFNPAVKNEKGEYVADETYKSVEGGHFVEGNLPRNESQGVHTVDDLVVTARGPKSEEIKGFMNSTEILPRHG